MKQKVTLITISPAVKKREEKKILESITDIMFGRKNLGKRRFSIAFHEVSVPVKTKK